MFMWIKMNRINKLLILTILFWIILAITFSFYDLKISKLIVNTNFFLFKYDFQKPITESLLFIVILIITGSFFTKKIQKEISYFALLISILQLIYCIIKNKTYLTYFYPIILITFVSILIILTYNKDWKNYVKIAIIILLLYVSTNIIVKITKVSFNRVRYCDLNNNYSNYTNWYIINERSKNKSFISGHTTSS